MCVTHARRGLAERSLCFSQAKLSDSPSIFSFNSFPSHALLSFVVSLSVCLSVPESLVLPLSIFILLPSFPTPSFSLSLPPFGCQALYRSFCLPFSLLCIYLTRGRYIYLFSFHTYSERSHAQGLVGTKLVPL